MTVNELIKVLQLYDDNMEVGCWDSEWGIVTAIEVYESEKDGKEIVLIDG